MSSSSDLYLQLVKVIEQSTLSVKKIYYSLFVKLKQSSSFRDALSILMDAAFDIYLGHLPSNDLCSLRGEEDTLFGTLAKLLVSDRTELDYFLSLQLTREDVITYYVIWTEVFYYLHQTLFENNTILYYLIDHPHAGCFFLTYAPSHVNSSYYMIMYSATSEEVDRMYVKLLEAYLDRWSSSPAILGIETETYSSHIRPVIQSTLTQKMEELLEGFLHRKFHPHELPMTKQLIRGCKDLYIS